MRLTFVVFVASVLLAAPVAAQDLLPGGFAQWTPAKVEKYACAGIAPLAGEDAAAIREYGCKSVERRAYSRGDDKLEITAYGMRDSTSAYGAFFFLRSADMSSSGVSELAAAAPGRTLAVAGSLLLDIRAEGLERYDGDLRALAADLKARSGAAPFPTLAAYLPPQGLISGTERFVLGPVALGRFIQLTDADWIGFDYGAEVQLARYRAGGQDSTLALVQYPTPQIASAQLENLRRWFNVNAAEKVVAGRPVVYAKRSSSLLAVVTQAASQNQAQALLEQVKYETQVTLNEPGFSATDPSWGEMVVGIFYGTGIILAFAVVSGIAFGLIRLVVKKMLPGKVFDRSTSVEILQLGLGSKPIEGKDFYDSPGSL